VSGVLFWRERRWGLFLKKSDFIAFLRELWPTIVLSKEQSVFWFFPFNFPIVKSFPSGDNVQLLRRGCAYFLRAAATGFLSALSLFLAVMWGHPFLVNPEIIRETFPFGGDSFCGSCSWDVFFRGRLRSSFSYLRGAGVCPPFGYFIFDHRSFFIKRKIKDSSRRASSFFPIVSPSSSRRIVIISCSLFAFLL